MTDHATTCSRGTGEEEARRWRELGFVEADDGKACGNWAPLALPEGDLARRHAEACRIGALYALDAIAHVRRFPQNPDRLVDLLRDMVLAGRWTGVEIGFAAGLSDHLSRGRVALSEDYEIVDLRRVA